MTRVDVVFGGPGREAAVSRRSGATIVAGLERQGVDVRAVDCAGEARVEDLRPGAIIYNTIHGTYGEDGTLQRVLDLAGFSYVGSDAAVSALCMDKDLTKQRLAKHAVRVPWGVVVNLGSPFTPKDLKLPHGGSYIMKPADDGSSVGLKVVVNPSFILPAVEELIRDVGPRRYVIEERLPGPEFTVAVIERDGQPVALPPISIRAQGDFDYHAKYEATTTVEEPLPAGPLADRLMALGVAAHRACGCRDVSRVDVMQTTDGDLAVLEVNTLPGMTTRSLLPLAAKAAGMSFDDLVVHFVRCVQRRETLV